MPFTVEDFPDLIRLLEQHPEWRAELRRQVLSDELLALPELVRQLVDAQARTDQRIAELIEQTAQRFQEMGDRIEALTVRTEQGFQELIASIKALTRQVGGLTDEVGTLKSDMLEPRYRDRGPAHFGRLARRLRALSTSALADLLDDAVGAGRLDDAEREEVLRTDLVLTGRRREDQSEVYLLAEVSVGIGPYDVDRAADRSALLGKLGRPVIAIAAGRSVTAEAADLARARGVILRLDGSEAPPQLV